MVEKVKTLTLEQLKKMQWQRVFNMCYIEPVVFALVFAHGLSGTIARNQMIYQTCTAVFNYNETICRELGNRNMSMEAKNVETEVQPYVANMFMMRTLLESIVPAICGIFIGSWSDHYGRRPLLIISMIGFSFTYVIVAVICELSHYYPVNPWYYIIAAVPHSILGGNCVFSVAAFCFISDVTDTKARPYRMIFMELFFFIGLMSGSLSSSFIYAATNDTITFSISAVFMIAATIFIITCVPESLHYKRDEPEEIKTQVSDMQCTEMQMCYTQKTHALSEKIEISNENKTNDNPTKESKLNESQVNDSKMSGTNENKSNKSTTNNGEENISDNKIPESKIDDKKPIIENNNKADSNKTSDDETENSAGLFSYSHIKDMLNTCFKKRPHYDRAIIWLITGVMFIAIFVMDGAMTVFYLFVRERFQWSIRDFTFFESIGHTVTMLGAVIGFLILRKVFNMSVVALALLSFGSDVISSIVRGIAYEDWHLYLAVFLGALKSIGGPMCRTIVSNIVAPTDLGKIFSIKNILQSFAPFLAAPLYTLIYQQSLTVYPGLFNIVSAVLYFVAFVFLIVVLRFKYTCKEHYAVVLK